MSDQTFAAVYQIIVALPNPPEEIAKALKTLFAIRACEATEGCERFPPLT